MESTTAELIRELWLPTLTLVGGSLSTYVLKAQKDKYNNKKNLQKREEGRNEFLKGLELISDAYGTLDQLREDPCHDRVLLLKLTNGGATPRPGSMLYAHAVKAFTGRALMNKKLENLYEGVKVDEEYIRMAISISQGEEYIVDVEEHPDCLLKHFYAEEDIAVSQVYHVYTNPKADAMWIASVATSDANMKPNFMHTGAQTARYLAVEKVRRIFEKNDELL